MSAFDKIYMRANYIVHHPKSSIFVTNKSVQNIQEALIEVRRKLK